MAKSIKTVYQLQIAGADGVVTGLKKVSTAAKDSETGVQGALGHIGAALSALHAGPIAAAIAGAATLKKGFNSLYEGSKLADLHENFVRIGLDIERIKAASSGTQTTTEIERAVVYHAQLFEQLGLTQTELQRVIETSAALADAYDQDLAGTIDAVARASTGSSKALQAQYGIVLDLEAAYQKHAESLGKTASALTAAEKRAAAYHETLTAIESQADRFPTKRFITPIDQITTKFKDLADSAKRAAAEAANAIAVSVGWADDTKPTPSRYEQERAAIAREMADAQRQLELAENRYSLYLGKNKVGTEAWGAEIDRVRARIDELTLAQEQNERRRWGAEQERAAAALAAQTADALREYEQTAREAAAAQAAIDHEAAKKAAEERAKAAKSAAERARAQAAHDAQELARIEQATRDARFDAEEHSIDEIYDYRLARELEALDSIADLRTRARAAELTRERVDIDRQRALREEEERLANEAREAAEEAARQAREDAERLEDEIRRINEGFREERQLRHQRALDTAAAGRDTVSAAAATAESMAAIATGEEMSERSKMGVKAVETGIDAAVAWAEAVGATPTNPILAGAKYAEAAMLTAAAARYAAAAGGASVGLGTSDRERGASGGGGATDRGAATRNRWASTETKNQEITVTFEGAGAKIAALLIDSINIEGDRPGGRRINQRALR